MCSNMLGTALATKAWTPANFFCKWGQLVEIILNMKGQKAPLPMKNMAPKKRKKASHMEENSPVRGKSTLHEIFWGFSMGDVERLEAHALANDNKMYSIFRNHSSHNYVKNTL